MGWLARHSTVVREQTIAVSLEISPHWTRLFRLPEAVSLGDQSFVPASGNFLFEGEWQQLAVGQNDVTIVVPPEDGRYQFWVCLVSAAEGWAYERNAPFLLINAQSTAGVVTITVQRITTIRALRFRQLPTAFLRALAAPFVTIFTNWSLLLAMVRRDILGLYLGSFGDAD